MSAPTYSHREIRAHYTDDTITVYQAYSTDIGTAAVERQRLDASPKFSTTRMTWIKPSWAWMMYRSGYSHKDLGQECILALSVKRDVFIALLETAVVATSHTTAKLETKSKEGSPRVRVQWDPERTVHLEKLPHRSIQIGVPGPLVRDLVEGIVRIEDVTNRARGLKKMIDESPDVETQVLVEGGLIPVEMKFAVSEELQRLLGMTRESPHDQPS